MTPKLKATLGAVAAAVTTVIGSVVYTEGGYVNDPKDPGGATNHGITEVVARKHGYQGNMKDLPKDLAEDIYIKDYVISPGYDKVIGMSYAVGHKLIDIGVNAGIGRSSLWFQRSLNAVNRGGADYPKIAEDGKIGSGTLAAYQGLQKKRGKVEACRMVIKMLDAQQTMHYMNLNMPTFTPGWVINRSGNVPLSDCSKEISN